jgi:hypothetical protein
MEIAIFVGFLILLRFIIKNTKIYTMILGIILMLAAVPAGIFTELGLNGCCGAPDSNFKGIGYLLMVALFSFGLFLLVVAIRSLRK